MADKQQDSWGCLHAVTRSQGGVGYDAHWKPSDRSLGRSALFSPFPPLFIMMLYIEDVIPHGISDLCNINVSSMHKYVD